MFPPDFQPFSITTQADPPVTIHGLTSFAPVASGSPPPRLPPLLLLHGFPQTHLMWHRVVTPALLARFSVVLMDLRGYGASSKPAGVGSYAKSAMARDCVAVMDALLGGGAAAVPFFVAAHDRGARVAHKLMVDHAARVRKCILLDIAPTLAMYEQTDMRFATAYFHWFFLTQPAPLPESLLGADPRNAGTMFLGGFVPGALSVYAPEAREAYVAQNFGHPEGIAAMCNDYRAAATVDLEEAREDLRSGRKITCPLLVLWGRTGVIEKCFDALAEWRKVADDGVDVQGWAVESGHMIPEQKPEDVEKAILDFFV